MKSWYFAALLAVGLSACANSGSGSNQIYGSVTGGVETTQSF